MLDTIIKTLWIALLLLVSVFVIISVGQLGDLENRVTALEEAGTSWDITIVRPATEEN